MYGYSTEDKELMQRFYRSLSEKDRRRYAAIEVKKLGHGGNRYIANILGCDPKTIRVGLRELESLPEKAQMPGRMRRPGGGRKPYDQLYPNIDEQFLSVLREHTAGDPMREDVRWTDLTHQAIIDQLVTHYQLQVSETVVRKLLKKHGYRRRKAQKNRA